MLSAALPAAGSAPSPRAGAAAGERFEASTSPDGRVVTVRVAGEEVLRLTDGYLLRLRCSPDKDQWLGYDGREISLGWLPNDYPEVAAVRAVVEEAGARLRIAVEGTKPQFPNTTFRATVSGELDGGSIRYTISSELRAQPAMIKALRARDLDVEYIDVWFDKIFWPARYRGGRERYDELVFGTPAGVVRTPKLHVFPVTSVPSVTYETVEQPAADGSFFAVLDSQANDGLLMSLDGLSSAGRTALCWHTWDTHFLLFEPNAGRSFTYTMTISALDAAGARALRERAAPIPFESDPDYALPVFRLEGANDFRDRVRRSDDWTWERTSADAYLDATAGVGDAASATIRSRTKGRKAWYARALWADPWHQVPITGRYRLSAMIRTSELAGAARIGVVASDHVDPLLYEEENAERLYSAPLSGENDWTRVSLDFEATGRQMKVVLEQSGRGQTWFDDVRIDPLCDPRPGERAEVAFHARTGVEGRVRRFDLAACRASRPEAISPRGLILAWRDSWAATPAAALPPGRYRLVLHARGEGCAASPPVLRVTGPPGLDRAVEVRPDANDDYVVEFTLDAAQAVSFRVELTNDGPCDGGDGSTRDRNAFVRALSLHGPVAARP